MRQALTNLRSIGLIDVRHGDGYYLLRAADEIVPTMAVAMLHSEADHAMVWEAREAIEVHAARLAASRATADDLAAMQGALDAMQAEIDAGEDGVDGDARFHRLLVDAAHNPMLSQIYADIAGPVDRTSAASLSISGRPPDSLRAHRAVLEAIGDRDPDRAASEMTSHLRASARAFTSPPAWDP